jgi:uncharacterized lipoprotein YmbA
MVRQTGANTVDVSDQNRRAWPLGDLTRRVLTQDLAAALPKDMVVLPDPPAPAGTSQLVLALAQFGPDAAGQVKLEGSWSLLRGDPAKVVLHHAVSLQDAAAGTPGEQAAAMSALLGELAAQIASGLAGRV